VISHPTDGFLPRHRRRPLAFITIIKWRYKKNGENLLCFDDFSVVSLTFFQLNCYFRANARSVILQPTDGFFPCHHCHPLAFIETKHGRKQNGEKAWHIGDFSVVSVTFFQLNCYLRGHRSIRDIAADRWIFALPMTPLDCVGQLKAALLKER
jgi:hypothetical protein